MWLVWKDKFTKTIDRHAPLKTRKIGKNRTPWMTNEILLNKRLGEKCVEFLETNLAADNVFVVLEQALQFDEEKLEKKCWDMIDMERSEAIVSDAWKLVNVCTLVEFLKQESLNVEEVDLFKAVVKWSEAECLRQEKETNGTNKRAAVGNLSNSFCFDDP